MDYFQNHTVLIIAPHPDDEVFGAGGLIHRAKREGAKVFVLYMTVGTTKDFSKRGLSTEEERIHEIKKVVSFLHIDGYKIAFPGEKFHLKLDTLPQSTIINEIERGSDVSLQALKPTMVITSSKEDYNQDHRAAGLASITATRPQSDGVKSLQRTVLAYEYPASSWTTENTLPIPTVFFELTKQDLRAKLQALRLYRSQLKIKDGPLSVTAVETLAKIRGVQSGVPFAEAFFPRRLLV